MQMRCSLLSCAKLLRQSKQQSVRDNIYINRNLTKVEARLAYEEHCRRRELQRQRQSLRHNYSSIHHRHRAVAQHIHEENRRPIAGRLFTRSASAMVIDNPAAVNARTTSSSTSPSPSNFTIPVIISGQGSLPTAAVLTGSESTVPASWSSAPSATKQAWSFSYSCRFWNRRSTLSCFSLHLRLHIFFSVYPVCHYCIGRPIHCNHYVGHYIGFSGISRSILNRFAPNLQA